MVIEIESSIHAGNYDDVPEIYKIELTKEITPRESSYKECSMCGRRWYRGSIVLRIKKRRYNYYCPQPKYHITDADEFRKLTQQYNKVDGLSVSPQSLDTTVMFWKSKQDRLAQRKKVYENTSETLIKNGKVQVDKDHPDYDRLVKALNGWKQEVKKQSIAQLKEEEEEILRKAKTIRMQIQIAESEEE